MSAAKSPSCVPGVIAVTGCDGSGKSTLTAALEKQLAHKCAAEFVYLGQSSGRIGEWIQELPVIGGPFGRYLLKKSDSVHEKPSTPPGNVTALVIYLLSRWRLFKFKRMLRKARRGTLIIADRYPQAEVAGFRFDGPQLSKTAGGNWWVAMLRRHEQTLYQWMAGHLPALLIRLNVDIDTAHQRKPDHKREALRQKLDVIPTLTFNGAPILDIDGCRPAQEVLQVSLEAIARLDPRCAISTSSSV